MGLGAGAIAVGTSFATMMLIGGIYLPQLASAAVFSLVPGFLESRAAESLGPLAKDTTFVVASVLNVVFLGLIPVSLQRIRVVPRRRPSAVAVWVVIPYVGMLALGLLFLGLTPFVTQPTNLGSLAASLLVPALIFGVALSPVNLLPEPAPPAAYPTQRRNRGFTKRRRLFIKSTVGAAAGAVLLYYGIGLLFPKHAPLEYGEGPDQVLSAQVTPNDEFYRLYIDVFPPSIDSSTWSLNLHGLVANPMTLKYSDLLVLPSIEEYATLECVSNMVGDDLMSTALWKGVQLKNLLNSAGVNSGAEYVVFRCYDGYDVGIPIERATEDGAILAYEMNGVPLPAEHGFPVRAIVPGLYGMMNAKWITEIELVQGVYEGFWQQKGWTNIATYQTGSTIITPGSSQLRDRFPLPLSLANVAGSQIAVVGVAFAGDRGIQKVEVSEDGGNSWQPASLYDPLSQYTWVFWKYEWNPPASGWYSLMVRATDGTGQVQVATMTDPFPDGATGYDVVDVRVSV